MKPHRLFLDKAILMVCDIQEKFMPRVYGKEGVLEASTMMIRAAKILGIPILITEQTRKVMGQTCVEIKKHLTQKELIFEKTKFSMIIPEVAQALEQHKERTQAILIGMETQVCILQTCMDLMERNYEVFLPVDAITSMRSWERTVGLKRMESAGATLTTFESSVFELLKDAKNDKFKDILGIIKQTKRENAISHL